MCQMTIYRHPWCDCKGICETKWHHVRLSRAHQAILDKKTNTIPRLGHSRIDCCDTFNTIIKKEYSELDICNDLFVLARKQQLTTDQLLAMELDWAYRCYSWKTWLKGCPNVMYAPEETATTYKCLGLCHGLCNEYDVYGNSEASLLPLVVLRQEVRKKKLKRGGREILDVVSGAEEEKEKKEELVDGNDDDDDDDDDDDAAHSHDDGSDLDSIEWRVGHETKVNTEVDLARERRAAELWRQIREETKEPSLPMVYVYRDETGWGFDGRKSAVYLFTNEKKGVVKRAADAVGDLWKRKGKE